MAKWSPVMLRLSFRYRFEAAHRFVGTASPTCSTPHGHTWYAILNLDFRGERLNSDSMAVEFSRIKGAWRDWISETCDHSYFHHWQDPVAETTRQCQKEARLLPFPGDPTTELIALLFFAKMEKIIGQSPLADLIEIKSIKIEETPTNHIECDRAFYSSAIANYSQWSGWWTQQEISSRELTHGTA